MKNGKAGLLIITSAIIWGLVIVGCSLQLKGTECYNQINIILYGGVVAHFLLIWTPLGIKAKKKSK